MKLSDLLSRGSIHKKGQLNKTIKLDNGEKRKRGDVVSILFQNEDGTYHAEDNEWACKINRNEFDWV